MKPYPPLPAEDLKSILTHTAELWAEARGKSFFITGGTGFFGMWLLESFAHCNDVLALNAKATVLTRDPAAFAQKAPHLCSRSDLDFIQGDITDFTFPSGTFHYVIHAATEASAKLNEEDPGQMLHTIAAGMKRMLQFVDQASTEKFLFTSSGAVYGKQPSNLTHIPEDFTGAPDPLSTSSAYGEGKRLAELMLAIHAKQSPCQFKIARCFAFVGPHLPLDSHFAIGNFLRDAMAGQAIRINGDGSPRRSYLYASDLAIWLWTILFKAPSLKAYNVGSEAELSIAEIAHQVKQTLASTSPIQMAGVPKPDQAISRYVPCVHRAFDDLQLSNKINLEDAIGKTQRWLNSTVL